MILVVWPKWEWVLCTPSLYIKEKYLEGGTYTEISGIMKSQAIEPKYAYMNI